MAPTHIDHHASYHSPLHPLRILDSHIESDRITITGYVHKGIQARSQRYLCGHPFASLLKSVLASSWWTEPTEYNRFEYPNR